MSWAEQARESAIALMTGEERQDDSITAQLIRDIHAIFWTSGHDRMKTADLLSALYEIEESPWGDWYGKPLTAHALSRLLHVYRVKTMPVKVEGQTVRGYKVEQFEDAFAQLALQSVTSVTSVSHSQSDVTPGNAGNASVREQGVDDAVKPLECLTCGGEYWLDELHPERLRCPPCVARVAA